jgi:N-acetylmuramoyl-L-alanine amidase
MSIVLAFLTSSFDMTVPVPAVDKSPSIRKVVIDPGHGGKDPGCRGRTTVEKDIALSIGLELGKLISAQYPEIEVIYTRKTDVFIPLDERARIANKADADLFISIHCNTISRRNMAQGSETFVMGLHRAPENLDVAKRENSSILMEDDYIQKYDGYDPDSPEGHIILSMYQNAYLDQSILFADCIERQFVNGLARKSRGVKQAGFLVLRTTTMPSVLVEAGFLSHDNDEAFLGNKENHETIARSIFNAFAEYRAILEGLLPEDGGPLTASTMPVAQNSNPKPTVPETPPAVKPTPPQPSTPAKPAVVVATTPPKSKPADASIPVKTTPVKPLDISFYVQLAASKAALPPSVTNWKTNVAIERLQEDGYYKYLAGPFKDIEQANVALTDIRQKDSKDAFVVAYRDKQRISVKDAIAALQ